MNSTSQDDLTLDQMIEDLIEFKLDQMALRSKKFMMKQQNARFVDGELEQALSELDERIKKCKELILMSISSQPLRREDDKAVN